MKKITLFSLLALGASAGVQAQLADDFESYNVGDYLGANSPNWTTWSGTTGGAEDVQIVDNEAYSGSKSIYFSSTSADGGPQDVVLPFGGGVISTGEFRYDMYVRVESGKGAYFNFQGSATIGEQWTLDCQMNENGEIVFRSDNTDRASSTFTHDTWFKITVIADLNTSSWDILIDDNSIGTFSNPFYQVASLDIFPVNATNNQSGFWIDSVAYDVTPYTPTALNASLIDVQMNGKLAGQSSEPSVTVRNLGTTAITSFDLEIAYDGTTITKSVTGVNIAQNTTLNVTMDDAVALVSGTNDMVATISNVNGGTDDFAGDDVKTVALSSITPAAQKVVVGEEATGTWCGWCPRGAVALEFMEENYHDYFIGIAVHNGDPMTISNYDTGLGTITAGYPSAVVDRQADIDPGAFENDFLNRITEAPVVTLGAGAQMNATNDSIYISITSEFIDDANGNYKLALVIVEDSLTGTGNDWAQSNYYSGGNNGVMGGYEALPNPVPANQMVYDHVARLISPSFAGQGGVYPASVTSGQTFTHTFIIPIDVAWNLDKLGIVGMVMAPDGKVENGVKEKLADAITNGFTDGTNIVGITKVENPQVAVSLFPNPTSDMTFVTVNSQSNEKITVSVYDMNGKLVLNKIANPNAGQIEVSAKGLNAGIYQVKVEQGQSLATRKLIVK